MEVELLNFNHTYTNPEKFTIGPFTINITKEHCSNLKKLPRSKSFNYTFDENLNRVVIENPEVVGGWVETATAQIDEKELVQSLFFPEVEGLNIITDLCFLLTFLTGRRVTTEEYIDNHNPSQSLDRSVNIHNIIFWGDQCWNNLIAKKGIDWAPFTNFTYAFESREFLGMSVYIFSTLNAIYEVWWKKKNMTYIKGSTKKNIKKNLRSFLTNSINLKLKRKLLEILKDKEIDADIVGDIEKQIIDKIRPSAIFKLEKFLRFLEVYPEKPSKEHSERLRYINVLRNRLFHSGNIPQIKGISPEQSWQIYGSMILLTLSIIQFYFSSELLGIPDYRVDSAKKDITDYFQTGKFRGQDFFNETYAEFLERRNDEWINKGIPPG